MTDSHHIEIESDDDVSFIFTRKAPPANPSLPGSSSEAKRSSGKQPARLAAASSSSPPSDEPLDDEPEVVLLSSKRPARHVKAEQSAAAADTRARIQKRRIARERQAQAAADASAVSAATDILNETPKGILRHHDLSPEEGEEEVDRELDVERSPIPCHFPSCPVPATYGYTDGNAFITDSCSRHAPTGHKPRRNVPKATFEENMQEFVDYHNKKSTRPARCVCSWPLGRIYIRRYHAPTSSDFRRHSDSSSHGDRSSLARGRGDGGSRPPRGGGFDGRRRVNEVSSSDFRQVHEIGRCYLHRRSLASPFHFFHC